MHKYLYIFIKLKCYMFDLNAIWMFTYLDCLSVNNGSLLFQVFECKEWVKRAYTSWNVHLDFMIEYIIKKYGIMKWHKNIFLINNVWVNVNGCPLFWCAMNSIVVQKINKVWKNKIKRKVKKMLMKMKY